MSRITQRLNQHLFDFKASQKTGPGLKVSSNRLGEPGIELRTPGYKASELSTTPRRLTQYQKFIQLHH